MLALVAALLTLGSATGSPAAGVVAAGGVGAATPPAREASAAVEGAADNASARKLVLLGTAGLRWEDLDPGATPALWRLAQNSAIGSLVTRSVRTASCPADGWLALSSGNRAADAEPDGPCRELAEPPPTGEVPRWDVYTAERDTSAFRARLGLLGDLLSEHGHEALAVGPGAAIALASSEGYVERYAPMPATAEELSGLVERELPTLGVVVVDLGVVTQGPGTAQRAEQVATVEARVEAVLEALDPVEQTDGAEGDGAGATVILASLADAGPRPQLQVLTVSERLGGTAGTPLGLLTSGSTRQDGYVLATDLTPTVLAELELADAAPPGALIGARARIIAGSARGADAAPGEAAELQAARTVASMVDQDRHATAVQTHTPGLFAVLLALNLALYAAVWLRGLRTPGPVRIAGVILGALPIATFLANLVPWWRAGALGLHAAVAGAAMLVAGLALLGPWRRHPWGPAAVVAGVTSATIVLDVLTGSRLQLGAPLGVHPLVAGRFYGLNNSAFALLLVSSLLVSAVVGSRLAARGQRAWALASVLSLGLVVTVVDGMPGLGSDFGGPPALVPAFGVLALGVAGLRVGWRRLALILGVGIAVVSGFAILDWLRPEASRTHLGRFVQTVLDGGLIDVLTRKLGQNLTILGASWPVILAVAVLVTGIWLARRSRTGAAGAQGLVGSARAAREAVREVPALRVVVPAALTGLAIGFAVNDSGLVILAVGAACLVPLAIAAIAAHRALRAGE